MKKADIAANAEAVVEIQYAALCYRLTARRKTEILLITSRDTGRWVLPKGWPISGLTPAESAAREAFEEAGVSGPVGTDCLGMFPYAKVISPDRDISVLCAVYPLQVTRRAAEFPEKGLRRLKWFSPRQAAEKVGEPALSALLKGFDASQIKHESRPAS